MHLSEALRQASALRQSHRYPEAARMYERVLALAPTSPTAWYNLGLCQRMCGQFAEALRSYQKAIDLGLEGPEEAHLNRAVIYTDELRREADAEGELQRALAANPTYAPALLNFANLAEDLGRRAEALEAYERLLAAHPQHWEGLARYATLLPRGEASRGAIAKIETALRQSGLSEPDRASLGFALGCSLDRAARYDDAFAAYVGANASSQRAYGGAYDRSAAESQAQAVMSAFVGGVSPDQSWAPTFICGMFRSGSTLCEQILAGHPRITPCGELNLLPKLLQRAQLRAFSAASDGDVEQLRTGYEYGIKSLFPEADLATDKFPGNFPYVGLIKRMFPNAKIIHTVRHPLDNVLSVYFLHLDARFGYSFSLLDAAHHLRMSRRIMAHWRQLYPGDVFDFDYDEFVAQPSQTARRLLEFLDLDWDDECLAFHRRANPVKTASVWQVREPLYTTSSGRWKHYAHHLTEVRAYVSDLL
jgi:Tfp pilus assembly protein PilF